MIGMGIYVDREYRRARGIGEDTGAHWQNYVRGVGEGYDTTMDVTPEQGRKINWDFNNVVTHGKSTAMLLALESVIGAKALASVHLKAVKEWGGRRMDWRDFQRMCEAESGQDLEWFFEQWARSSRSAMYKVAGQECKPAADGFDCTVSVGRAGTLLMPVTVAARFADGSEQRARTERLAGLDTLRFHAKAELKEVVIEPDHAVILAAAPVQEELVVREAARDMPYTGAGARALEVLEQAKKLKIEDAAVWRKLALTLYDGRYYAEALDALQRLLDKDPDTLFFANVWQGHILDLLGRRAEAVTKYAEAAKVPGSPRMQHSQYDMTIDKAWVAERLKTPFIRR
jgi:tetratricopeptide (TPR) repeat protein